jgi:hypothetical protein
MITTICGCTKGNPAEVSLNYLQIETEPAYAEIYVDERYVGLSPLNTSKLLVGPHILKISKNGYFEISDAVNVLDNHIPILRYDLTSKPEIIDFGFGKSLSYNGGVMGLCEEFSKINSIVYFIDFKGINRDKWIVREKWYRDNSLFLDKTREDVLNIGEHGGIVNEISNSTNFFMGDYNVEIYIRENLFEYKLINMGFRVLQ